MIEFTKELNKDQGKMYKTQNIITSEVDNVFENYNIGGEIENVEESVLIKKITLKNYPRCV